MTNLEGIIKQVIGHKNDSGMGIPSIAVTNGISTKFPNNMLSETDGVPNQTSETNTVGCRNLRNQFVVIIDGEDAKDLDDAVTVEKLENGNYFLGVYTADISYYVTQGNQLDREAYKRGTNVYLADQVIPMIPQRLSSGICSLNPHAPRLIMSCEMEVDPNGRVVPHRIFPSVIQTTERMTYMAVSQILEDQDEETMQRYTQLVPMFQGMSELHRIFETMRIRRGAISFEDHEAKILVDAEGHPNDAQLRSRGVGKYLIESLMPATNGTVAEHYNKLNLPFTYRIHKQPKEEEVQRFFDSASTLGILVWKMKGTITSKNLQHVIEGVEDKPEIAVIDTMLLRSI